MQHELPSPRFDRGVWTRKASSLNQMHPPRVGGLPVSQNMRSQVLGPPPLAAVANVVVKVCSAWLNSALTFTKLKLGSLHTLSWVAVSFFLSFSFATVC